MRAAFRRGSQQGARARSSRPAARLNGLAQVLRLRSRYVEVEPLYKRALSIWAKSVGEEHPDYARVLGNLADYDFEQGKTPEAVRLYRRSVSILTAALGPEHPDVIRQRGRSPSADAALHGRPNPGGQMANVSVRR